MIKKNNNIFDYLIIFMICLIFFGDLLGGLQPIRVFSLFSIPLIFLLNTKFNTRLIDFAKVLFLLYCFIVISLFWTSDRDQGFKEIFYYLIHFSLFFLVPLFEENSKKGLKSLLLGWVLFVFFTQLIAFNEIFFDSHLPVSTFQSDYTLSIYGDLAQKKFASVTFGNYNTYSMIIVMALPFLFGFLTIEKNFILHFFTLLVILFSYIILLVNASRGGILAGFVILTSYFLVSKRADIPYLKFKVLVGVPVILFFLFSYYFLIFEQIELRFRAGSSFFEDDIRLKSYSESIKIFLDNPLFGTGIGSLKLEMQKVGESLPHNLFLEILIQFGLFILILFISFVIIVFLNLKHLDLNRKIIVYSILFSIPFISIINSGYLLHPVFWVYLGSIYSLISKTKYNNWYD